MAVRQTSRQSGGTKARILDAAEDLFIKHGYEAMSMRQITSRAAVNLAAVNYHFGSKEALIHAMLSRRLDQLNDERLLILDRFDEQLGANVTCEHILGAMFIPALHASRDPQRGGRALLRLIGRAYTDSSAFVRNFLTAHYAPVAGRFFDAFQRTLPNLPRAELGWRLHYAIGALAGALAGTETESLIDEFTQGRTLNDVQMIARLASLIVAVLKAPMPGKEEFAVFELVLSSLSSDSRLSAAQAATEPPAASSEPMIAAPLPETPPASPAMAPASAPAHACADEPASSTASTPFADPVVHDADAHEIQAS